MNNQPPRSEDPSEELQNIFLLQLSTITEELVYPCTDGKVCMFFMGATLLGLVPWMLKTGVVDCA